MILATNQTQKINILRQSYIQLIEEAYNYSELDPSLSNISEFKASKILSELNQLSA